MDTLSPGIIEKFCKICNWSYESWVTYRTTFDDNPNIEKLRTSECSEYFTRLRDIMHEYTLLQLMKLHDPVVMGNSINLTLEYVINYGGWDQKTVLELKSLLNTLNRLMPIKEYIKPARNKVLCHNELKAIIDNLPLGKFDEGKDVEYFDTLQKFVNLIYGEPYPFNDLAKNDGKIFCNLFVNAADERARRSKVIE